MDILRLSQGLQEFAFLGFEQKLIIAVRIDTGKDDPSNKDFMTPNRLSPSESQHCLYVTFSLRVETYISATGGRDGDVC